MVNVTIENISDGFNVPDGRIGDILKILVGRLPLCETTERTKQFLIDYPNVKITKNLLINCIENIDNITIKQLMLLQEVREYLLDYNVRIDLVMNDNYRVDLIISNLKENNK